MPSAPSYYDSIGLLAICDSIDQIDGIPFDPEKSVSPPSSPEPEAADQKVSEPLQHTLLTHVPVTGVVSPIGSMPYAEQQRVAYAQLASTGQLPTDVPPHVVGGVRPNVPVAHNLQTGSLSGVRRVAPFGDSSADMSFNAEADQADVLKRIALLQGAAAANSVAGTQLLSSAASTTAHASTPHISTTHVEGDASPALSDAASPVGSSTRQTTPGSPVESGQAYVEVCQICGRDFKGRKAATHKQQHIRRLHPAEYTPKRGGKKKPEY